MPARPLAVAGVFGSLLLLVSPSAAGASTSVSAKAPRFSITNLGTLHGGADASAYGLNDSGDVTGRSAILTGSRRSRVITTHAFLYREGHMVDLGAPHGSAASLGFGVNSSGQVAGGAIRSGFETPEMVSASGPAHSWQALPTRSRSGYALGYGINSAGWVAGSIDGVGAVLWERTRRAYDIRVLNRARGSAALAIDNRGDVVGFAKIRSGFAIGPARLWQPDAAATLLNGLSGHGAEATSIAQGSNGEVVVGGASMGSRGRVQPIEWLLTGRKTLRLIREPLSLGVPRGYDSAEVEGVNGHGIAVGFAWHKDVYRAVMWKDDSCFLLDALTNGSHGWNLMRAQAINARGQIAGSGAYRGRLRPFLLTPEK